MSAAPNRIAINAGGAYVTGLNAVVAGAVLAANELGWEVTGIRDGYEGLLFHERYPHCGLMKLTPDKVAMFSDAADALLGTSSMNPFSVRTLQKYEDDMEGIEEVDRSGDVLAALQQEQIDGVISIVGRRAMGVAWKLGKKGVKTVCVPESVENDTAATVLSFGFNTALSFTVELLERLRRAALAGRKVAVVEVLGQHAGWLALQAGIASSADAILIPEIPFDLAKVAQRLTQNRESGRAPSLIVVSEGARAALQTQPDSSGAIEHTRRALSPGSSEEGTDGGRKVIDKSGAAAGAVALEIQRRSDRQTFPFVLSEIIRGGRLTATDCQLGMAYGAAAVHGLRDGHGGVLTAFQPEIAYVPLADAVNKIRTVPPTSQFLQAARAMGISLGD